MLLIHINSQIGSSSLYDGSALAAFTNSVVVVVNWRVGIFGMKHQQRTYNKLNVIQICIELFTGDFNAHIFQDFFLGTTLSTLLVTMG